MAASLTEEQIVRFSRQILLRDVGGNGQLRLCETGIQVEGSTEVAVYLAAGGSKVTATPEATDEHAPGFASVTRIQPSQAHSGASVTVLNARTLTLSQWERGVPTVLVGTSPEQGSLAIAFGYCGACVWHTARDWTPPPEDWSTVGAPLAALAAQRLVLGITPESGVLHTDPDGMPGELRPLELREDCEGCEGPGAPTR